MRPTWSLVACAALLGGGLGVAATLGLRAAQQDESRGPDTPDPATATAAERATESPDRAPGGRPGRKGAESSVQAPAPTSTAPETRADAKAQQAEKVRGWIADLARARETKDRKLFDEAMRGLLGADDAAAQQELMELIADPDFDFPDSMDALRVASAKTLLQSKLPGWTEAAKARYERDAKRPGRSWDAHGWLQLVAAHADAADLAWIADQFDVAVERRDEVMAAIGLARADLAREAILREVRRRPMRAGAGEGIRRAVENLERLSPADAWVVLDEIVRSDQPVYSRDGDLERRWVRCAPADRLPGVRARISEIAASASSSRIVMPLVQALSDRGENVAEFASVIASAGRELRRLVDDEKQADGTGPFYAIEYHKVAHTPENAAALEYAIQQLGSDRTRGCQNVLARIRSENDWK